MGKDKTSIVLVALFLLIVPSGLFVSSVKAANIPTYAFMTVSPDPVGVNQPATIIMWINTINPTTSGVQGDRWHNYGVTVTRPDASTEQLGPFNADPAAYAYTQYTPNQVGKYTLKFSFPGQQVTGVGGVVPIPINDFYQASTYTTTLTVQQQPIGSTPQTPLPSGFWSRPINAQNEQWYTISGNWLGQGTGSFGSMNYNNTGNFNPYTKAPDSAHIVWTKALTYGGLIGGEFGGTTTSNYYTGKSYEPKLTPPVIINGVVYYNAPATPKMGFYAVDLRTGETLWWANSSGPAMNVGANPLIPTYGFRGITMGQVYDYVSPNQIGGTPYLWYIPSFQVPGFVSAFDWVMYDAVTGNQVLTVTNTTAGGVTIEGPNGELLIYVLGTNWLALWNSSLCIGTAGAGSTQAWLWRPNVGATLDWRTGVQWNVTTPVHTGQAISQINSGVILATTGSQFVPGNYQMEIGYDATTGAQLWVQNRTLPMASTNFGRMGPMMNGIFTEFQKETMQWFGYDAHTGNQIWGPTDAYANAWGSQPRVALSAYGMLFGQSIDGIHAFNLATGKKLWDFYADPSGYDFPGFSTYPYLGGNPTIADGKIFAPTGNSHSDPLFLGASLYSINATTGKQLWKINGFYLGTLPVSDGYLLADNAYDNLLYCFGKGLSATTVSTQTFSAPQGTPVLVQGTVTDQSPGQTCLGIPAKGTPAVSDDIMSAWMEYLYMGQSKPNDAVGVNVHLTAFDPNNNTEDLGYVMSDVNGNYAVQWTPPVPGVYKVIATFEGSNSYYSSSSETALSVISAPHAAAVATPTPAPTQPAVATPTPAQTTASTVAPTPSPVVIPPTSATPIMTYVAVVAVVVVVVAAAAVLVLRRRK